MPEYWTFRYSVSPVAEFKIISWLWWKEPDSEKRRPAVFGPGRDWDDWCRNAVSSVPMSNCIVTYCMRINFRWRGPASCLGWAWWGCRCHWRACSPPPRPAHCSGSQVHLPAGLYIHRLAEYSSCFLFLVTSSFVLSLLCYFFFCTTLPFLHFSTWPS